jgi:hypothetical protein
MKTKVVIHPRKIPRPGKKRGQRSSRLAVPAPRVGSRRLARRVRPRLQRYLGGGFGGWSEDGYERPHWPYTYGIYSHVAVWVSLAIALSPFIVLPPAYLLLQRFKSK